MSYHDKYNAKLNALKEVINEKEEIQQIQVLN